MNPGWGYLKRGVRRELFRLYPDSYLDQRAVDCGLPIYGCKIMPYHFRFPVFAIRRLHTRGWKIVHVYRNDVARQSLSKLVAASTGHWHRRKGDRNSVPEPTIIEVGTLEQEIRKRRRIRQIEDRAVLDMPCMNICYETDLQFAKNREETMGRVFSFLDVKPAPVQTNLIKTHAVADEDLIANLDEIRHYLAPVADQRDA